MSLLSDIKDQIKVNLDALVVSGDLGEVIVDDFTPNIEEKDIGAYPAALLATPSVDAEFLTNRDNERTYIFEVLIVSKGEDITTANDIELLIDVLLNKFDEDPTLGGTAITIEPATTSPIPITTEDRSFIIFTLNLRVRACKSLTF